MNSIYPRKNDYVRLLTMILERLDRIERMLSSGSVTQFDEDEVIDSRKARLLTKMSDSTLLRRRNDGSLPYFRHGGKIYYLRSQLMRALMTPDEKNHKT